MLGACGLNRIPCWDDTPMPMSSSIILWCWYSASAPRVCSGEREPVADDR